MNPAPPAPTPGFIGLFIPVEVLDMPELSHTDHMLLAWIDALSKNAQKACFASNDYFAKKLRLKENTVKILISKLVNLGLVERHSFDGRQRLLRTCKENWFNRDSQSTAEVDLNQPQTLKKINPRGSFKSTPSYIDNSIEKRIDKTPPTPKGKEAPVGEVAIAPKESVSSSKVEISEKAVEVANSMVEILKANSPVYRPPKSMKSFLETVGILVDHDKQDPKMILEVLEWAVNDREERDNFPGWSAIIYGKSGIQCFKKHLGRLHGQMISQPKRKFGANSNDRKALADTKAKKGVVL
jgi:hypothetical protein